VLTSLQKQTGARSIIGPRNEKFYLSNRTRKGPPRCRPGTEGKDNARRDEVVLHLLDFARMGRRQPNNGGHLRGSSTRELHHISDPCCDMGGSGHPALEDVASRRTSPRAASGEDHPRTDSSQAGVEIANLAARIRPPTARRLAGPSRTN
jgi:hypothetical protein